MAQTASPLEVAPPAKRLLLSSRRPQAKIWNKNLFLNTIPALVAEELFHPNTKKEGWGQPFAPRPKNRPLNHTP